VIKALIIRRFWLWRNRLFSNLFNSFLLPMLLFCLICLPLKNIIRFSLSGIAYDEWVFSGLVFIIGSICLFPTLYQEYFEQRIHKKVLINIALAPFSKMKIILHTLLASILEALIMIFVAVLIYTSFVSVPFTMLSMIFILFSLVIHLFLFGNLYISISLLVDTVTIMMLSSSIIFIYIIFGLGFIIEFPFFPPDIESILNKIPMALPFQTYQKYYATGFIDWSVLAILAIIIYLWILFNSYLLKWRLRQ